MNWFFSKIASSAATNKRKAIYTKVTYTKDPSSWKEALLLATESGAEGL